MDIVKKLIHDTLERKAAADSRQLPTPSTVREPSTTERNAAYLPVNYGLLFCPHGKSYFDVCTSCKRTRRMARVQYEHFCLKHGLEF
jgi:hypothetical protein